MPCPTESFLPQFKSLLCPRFYVLLSSSPLLLFLNVNQRSKTTAQSPKPAASSGIGLLCDHSPRRQTDITLLAGEHLIKQTHSTFHNPSPISQAPAAGAYSFSFKEYFFVSRTSSWGEDREVSLFQTVQLVAILDFFLFSKKEGC